MEPTVSVSHLWEPPAPVLFNVWKHHAGALRQRIAATVQGGEDAVSALPEQLLVIGTELMDLYTGALSPGVIAQTILEQLRAEGRLDRAAYRPWIEEHRGYRVVTLPEDHSCWVLRGGEDAERYIHVHPGRWTPHTRRVRANVLKTAVMVLAYAGLRGENPLDVEIINEARQRYLGLAAVRGLAEQGGLGAILEVLADGTS